MNEAQFLRSLGGVREVDRRRTVAIDLGRNPTKVWQVDRDKGSDPIGLQREHKSGRLDAKVFCVPTVVHRAYDYTPEQNAALTLRFPQLVDVRRLPFSRDVVRILECVTGKRYTPPRRIPCPAPTSSRSDPATNRSALPHATTTATRS
jgi:hypothetical protein